MKILKLNIENFGKLSDFEIEFDKEFNQFFHENGWGKSTLCAFIKAMFYGIEAKGRKKMSEREKFEPWQGGTFGGSLDLQVKEKRYRIFRTFGKTPEEDKFQLFDLNLNSVSYDYSENIGEELFGVGKETFVISAYFVQSDFISSINDEVVANLAGIEKYNNDAKQVENALLLLEKKRKQIVSMMPKQNEINQIESNIKNLENNIFKEQGKIDNYQKELDSIQNKKTEIEEKVKLEEKLKEQNSFILQEKENCQNLYNEKTSQLNNLLAYKPKNKKFIISGVLLIVAILFLSLYFFKVLPLLFGVGLFGLFLVGACGCLFFIKSDKPNKKEICALNNDINLLREKLVAFPQIEKQDIELYNIQNQVNKDLLETKLNLQNSVDNIEQYKQELEILQFNLSDLQSKIELFNNNIDTIKTTMKFLSETRKNVSARFVSPLNKSFENLFDKYSIDQKVTIDNNLNALVVTSQGIKSSEFLSRGYQDLIKICQRFSMLDKIFKKEKPPIILDDTFVNIDDAKFNLVKQTMQILSHTYQVLYFTCSESRTII